MLTDVKEKIMKCIDLEMACAEIYRTFMRLFPAERDFWEGLAKEEENHAKFYYTLDFLKLVGESPDQLSLPSLNLIDKTLDFAENIKTQIQTKLTITLEEALNMALLLEKSLLETYLFEIRDEDDSAFMDIKKMLVDEKTHVDKLEEFMIKKGYAKLV